ncbi:MAG: hypothetical protein ABSH25_22030, partial [Syntrophorhabdales bacterium]
MEGWKSADVDPQNGISPCTGVPKPVRRCQFDLGCPDGLYPSKALPVIWVIGLFSLLHDSILPFFHSSILPFF